MGLHGACNECNRTSPLFRYEDGFYCTECLKKKEEDIVTVHKNCPYCGHKYFRVLRDSNKYATYFYAACRNCSATGPRARKAEEAVHKYINRYSKQSDANETEENRVKALSELIDDFNLGAMRFVQLESPATHKRIIEQWNVLYERIMEELKKDGNDRIIKQQDEIIGRLTRKIVHLEDAAKRRVEWLRVAKEEAGFSINTSFESVWDKTLEKAKKFDSINMSRDEVEEFIVDYMRKNNIQNIEVACKYLISGFMLCLGIARNADIKKEESDSNH